MNLAITLPRFTQFRLPSLRARASRQACISPAQPQALPRHTTLRLDNRAQQVQVLRGCVWITRDGCPEDRVLEAGSTFDQHPGAPVLVHALADAEVRVVAILPDA